MGIDIDSRKWVYMCPVPDENIMRSIPIDPERVTVTGIRADVFFTSLDARVTLTLQ